VIERSHLLGRLGLSADQKLRPLTREHFLSDVAARGVGPAEAGRLLESLPGWSGLSARTVRP